MNNARLNDWCGLAALLLLVATGWAPGGCERKATDSKTTTTTKTTTNSDGVKKTTETTEKTTETPAPAK
jgi:hypothetical protein